MEILAYGEDALTLWALQNRLREFLDYFNDNSLANECEALFRPSFGRCGGDNSSQFGEFDFILLSKTCIYLGESKWDRSAEKIMDGDLTLRDEQLLRHKLFQLYIREWAFGPARSWDKFAVDAQVKLGEQGVTKPIALEPSLLAQNLQAVLSFIKKHYPGGIPEIKNVLLYLHQGKTESLPTSVGGNSAENAFKVVAINYSELPQKYGDNFVRINLPQPV